jgi:hypothetical protein
MARTYTVQPEEVPMFIERKDRSVAELAAPVFLASVVLIALFLTTVELSVALERPALALVLGVAHAVAGL